MISKKTWPNFHGGTALDGVQLIVEEQNISSGSEIEFGKTKLFVRDPRTLLELEKERANWIPMLCVLLQRVCNC